MSKKELYLKTIFCCMACDGDIAQEEIDLIKSIIEKVAMFESSDIEALLNSYVSEINKIGKLFLDGFLSALSNEDLTQDEEYNIIDISIKMIKADNKIQYSEVKFFKKIRMRLSLSDEQILERHPDIEDFLLPDIDAFDDSIWDNNIIFDNITLDRLVNK